MLDAEIERNEATVQALLLAFSGSRYAPRVQGYAGLYSITRRGSETITVTQAQIDEKGVGRLVDEICEGWNK